MRGFSRADPRTQYCLVEGGTGGDDPLRAWLRLCAFPPFAHVVTSVVPPASTSPKLFDLWRPLFENHIATHEAPENLYNLVHHRIFRGSDRITAGLLALFNEKAGKGFSQHKTFCERMDQSGVRGIRNVIGRDPCGAFLPSGTLPGLPSQINTYPPAEALILRRLVKEMPEGGKPTLPIETEQQRELRDRLIAGFLATTRKKNRPTDSLLSGRETLVQACARHPHLHYVLLRLLYTWDQPQERDSFQDYMRLDQWQNTHNEYKEAFVDLLLQSDRGVERVAQCPGTDVLFPSKHHLDFADKALFLDAKLDDKDTQLVKHLQDIRLLPPGRKRQRQLSDITSQTEAYVESIEINEPKVAFQRLRNIYTNTVPHNPQDKQNGQEPLCYHLRLRLEAGLRGDRGPMVYVGRV